MSIVEKAQQVQEFVMHHVKDAPDWHIGPYTVSLPPWLSSNLLMLILACGMLFYLFAVRLRRKRGAAPSGIDNALEAVVIFIRDEIAYAYLGKEDGRRLAPLLLTLFFTILLCNLMGLIPLFSTATANFNFTLAMAGSVAFFMTIGGMIKNGPVGYWSAFIPHGVPWPILLLIVPLEVIGVFIKSGVLALRLFANLLAGHLALFSILGLILTYGAVGAPALFLALFVFMLEILVALLQAYIFTLLAGMFIGQIYHPEH